MDDPFGARCQLVVDGTGAIVVIGRGPPHDWPVTFDGESVDLGEQGINGSPATNVRIDEQVVKVAARPADLVAGIVDGDSNQGFDAAVVVDPGPNLALVIVARRPAVGRAG